MRTIKFRGYNHKNKQWLYGFYLQNRDAHFVYPDEFATAKSWEDYEVDPNTVGQFTGICESGSYQEGVADADQMGGRMVYEGDIVVTDADHITPRIVVYYECLFGLANAKEYQSLKLGTHPYLNDYTHLPLLGDYPIQGEVRVLGNIHDNPELLTPLNPT